MDEAKMISLMKQEALPLAAQMGYSFTIDDVKSYELEMQQAKTGCEMSDEELQAVVGGVLLDFCFAVGINAETGDYGDGICFFFLGYINLRSNNSSARFSLKACCHDRLLIVGQQISPSRIFPLQELLEIHRSVAKNTSYSVAPT